eukprot:symbB.v1.2.027073.t1/scaffold2751.1/size71576/2
MKVSSGRSKRTPGQSCRPSLTEWVFCMFFSVTLACVAAVLSFRSLLHIQEEKYRPGFLEASTSITEAPTEPPVEAVLVFDSAMPGMLPKAVWHSKASQAVVPPLPPNTAGIEGLVQRTQVTTSAPNCEVLLPDLANRLAKDLHSAQEQRNLDLAVQAWKGLLSGKIQVDYMRQRLCSRMEAWFKSLTTMSWQSPRGVTSVLVWPQAAYLHFGVKRVWSLGEYTQWADLCAALATLGLQVKLWPFQKKSFPTPSIYESVNAVYTDYNGVHAGKGVGARPPPDKTWLLDTFGTDGTVVANDFFGRIPPLTDYPLHRFLTLVPGYSSRNTFLGVAAVAGSTEASTLPERRWQCVLWSKVHPWLTESNGFPAYHWKLLREYTKYCKVIATVDIKDTYKTAELIRTCCPAVEIREVQSPKAFQELIRGSAVYMASDEREKEAEDDVQQIISELTDNQKHELVGRILQEQDTEQWGAVFESAALQRFRERSIRFVEMSGRENELKLDPFERLGSIQQLLADQMDTNPREGMHRVVKCFHGSNRLGEDTIVAMLPEEVNIVITEEPDPDTETSSEYTDHGFSASNSYTDYSELSFD